MRVGGNRKNVSEDQKGGPLPAGPPFTTSLGLGGAPPSPPRTEISETGEPAQTRSFFERTPAECEGQRIMRTAEDESFHKLNFSSVSVSRRSKYYS